MNSFTAVFRYATAAVTLGAVTQACSNVGSLEGTAPPTPATLRMYATSRRVPAEGLPLLAERPVPAPGAISKPQSKMPAEAKSGTLLYVSDDGTDYVDIFRWPDGKPITTLAGFKFPQGLCADQKGDVWITDNTTSRIIEYAHGGRLPIKTLVEAAGALPASCSVDSSTGDLAVTNTCAASLSYFGSCTAGHGNLVIYRRARGEPKILASPYIKVPYFCSYDDHGNLFLDGSTYTKSVGLNELRKGAKGLENVQLDQRIGFPGGVQSKKTYLAVGDQSVNTVYQFHIAHGKATRIRATTLDAEDVVGFFIEGKTLIGPDYGAGWTAIWDYPQGSSPIKMLPFESAPVSAVISRSP